MLSVSYKYYPKETMGYYFYFPPENKIVVARYVEFFEKNLITQEVNGRAMDLAEIQDEDTSPSKITSEIPMEVKGFKPPQEEVISVRRSKRTHRAYRCDCLNVEAEEHSLGDLSEATSYKAAMLDSGSKTFSPIADNRAIRNLIAIAAFYDYEIWQMDVKIAFLNGYLDEDIYMVQPEGFVDLKYPRKVYKLQRYIYDLKQTSRSWNKRFNKEIKRFYFNQNLDEPMCFSKVLQWDVMIQFLIPCFAMKDLGKEAFILGIKIYRDRSKQFNDLVKGYMIRVLRDIQWIIPTCTISPWQRKTDLNKLKEHQTLKQGYVFILNGGAVDWKSSKQRTTAMSATKVEYIAAMEAVWIRKFISGLGARHYHRRYHYVRESIALGEIRFLKVHTDDNLADPFTKALLKGKITQHARSMGLRLASSFM
ncbi:retrotransposon protein, putative, ty1-copia subclass [Tanacetum coccineum]